MARSSIGGEDALAVRARVEAVLRDHHAVLLRIARRWSGSQDEAEDAVQRALEIYVRRLATVDEVTELAWLKVVVRHEAMALRHARVDGRSIDVDDLGDRLPSGTVDVEERLERDERTARSIEALARLKPDERTALLLKAKGFSYAEIGARQGWTYTKVNRSITEGRRRFMAVFRRIESGEECGRFAPTLLALVQGAAAASDVVALRPHLRHCAACRATVRELHASRLHRALLHLPVAAVVAPARWLGERVVDAGGEAPPGDLTPLGRGPDVAQLFDRVRDDAPRGRNLLHGLLNRLGGSDVATGVQMATSGGGRGTAVAALLGLCLSSAGAVTYCIATGVLGDQTGPEKRAPLTETKRAHATTHPQNAAHAAATATAQIAEPRHRPMAVVRTPAPQRSSQPRTHRRASGGADPAREFSFESAVAGDGGGGSTPAPPRATAASAPSPGASSGAGSSAPSGGGAEFLP